MTEESPIAALSEVLGQAERSFREGIGELLDLARNQPNAVLAVIGGLGFLGGTGLRQGTLKKPSDPALVFLTGALIGLAFGPRVMNRLDEFDSASGNVKSMRTARAATTVATPEEG